MFLTENAVNASVVSNDPSLLADLGLDDSSAQFPDPETGTVVSIKQLLINGANFEDGEDFLDSIKRTSNHFYDPIYDRPLTPCPAFVLAVNCNKSPDWALENNHDISSDPTVQIYSYKDANEYYYKALTESKKSDRDIYWGKTFQTLGHIVHHVQDMAQPEHVRNDQHITGYDTSYYEAYTDERRKFAVSGQDPEFLNLAQSGNYPIPDFPTAYEFWTTRNTDSAGARRGIADFTNANFVSKDTNFRIDKGQVTIGSEYESPAPGSVTTKSLSSLLSNGDEVCQKLKDNGPYDMPPDATCNIDFVQSNVIDNLQPTKNRTNEYASSVSIFDAYLSGYNIDHISIIDETQMVDIDRIPTLNRINYNETQKDVIPRAVSFSAGLINHFFKGRIDLFKNVSNNKWTISNLSAVELNGTFALYRESYDIDRTRTLVTQWNLDLQPNSQYELQNFVDAYPNEPKILVFKGKEGSQGTISGDYNSIAAKVVYPSNQIDVYAVGNGRVYFTTSTVTCTSPYTGTRSVENYDELDEDNYIAVSGNEIVRKWTVEYKYSSHTVLDSSGYGYYCDHQSGGSYAVSKLIDGVWLGSDTQFDINDPTASGIWYRIPVKSAYDYSGYDYPQLILNSDSYEMILYPATQIANFCWNAGYSGNGAMLPPVDATPLVDTYSESNNYCTIGGQGSFNSVSWGKSIIKLR